MPSAIAAASGAGRVASGPDRPDRLVGDDETRRRKRAGLMAREGAGELRVDDLAARPASRSASCSPTHRIGPQAGLDRPAELAADELVGLARVAPALGVADDDPGRQPGEHRGGDLAGVGAGQLVMDVLGADRDLRIAPRPARPGPRPGRRTAGR